MGGSPSKPREEPIETEEQKRWKEMQERFQQIEADSRKMRDENDRIRQQNEEIQRRALEGKVEQMKQTNDLQEKNQKILEKLQKMQKMEDKRKRDEWARRLQKDAERRVNEATFLQQEAQRARDAGIPPVLYPSGDDFDDIRRKCEYQEGNMHIAITGVSGAGKSSLVNAFRGISPRHRKAAKIGTSETTTKIGRWPDPNREWMVYYDVPGAGTLNIPSWQYFNNQGLYIFDTIIIAIGIRFTSIDIDILFNCKRFGIPVFVVRSKADQHIDNKIKQESSDDEDEDEDGNKLSMPERRMIAEREYILETRQEFKLICEKAGLPAQKVYIVSNAALRSTIKGEQKPKGNPIDELDLINDILHEATVKHGYTRDSPPTN